MKLRLLVAALTVGVVSLFSASPVLAASHGRARAASGTCYAIDIRPLTPGDPIIICLPI